MRQRRSVKLLHERPKAVIRSLPNYWQFEDRLKEKTPDAVTVLAATSLESTGSIIETVIA